MWREVTDGSKSHLNESPTPAVVGPWSSPLSSPLAHPRSPSGPGRPNGRSSTVLYPGTPYDPQKPNERPFSTQPNPGWQLRGFSQRVAFGKGGVAHLQRRFIVGGQPTPQGWLLAGTAGSLVLALIVPFVLLASVSVSLPATAPAGQLVKPSHVLDKDGNVIGTLRGEQNREDVSLDQVSDHMRQAVVATEDRFFYEHSGVSYRGIVRALVANIGSGSVAQGGSTITQQYARSAFAEVVGTSRSMSRKAREIDVARKIEDRYSKDEILELYLNNAYFGRRAYGVEAASKTYFKKPASDLSLGQAAYLAGVLRAPTRFQVEDDPNSVIQIRNEVLGDMERSGFISGPDAGQAKADDILNEFRFGPGEFDTARAGFFIEHVRRLLQTPEFGFTKAEVARGGLEIHTTLDLKMQIAAEEAVISTLDLSDDPEAALVAMDTAGHVRAMVGGRDVTDPMRARGFNFAANVRTDDGSGRQAGSAFKPFALAALIENGTSIRSRFAGPSRISINSARCRNSDGSPWKVSNFDGGSSGTVDVMTATVHSTNTVYAQIMDKVVSPEDFMKMAGKSGISIPEEDRGCALTLGTTPVTPMEMAQGFTTFAARGLSPEPVVITRVVSSGGKTLREVEPQSRRAMEEKTADQVNHVLKDVIQSGTGQGAKSDFTAAGKTGTTQNHADAWFAGYTSELTAVVWVGYPPDQSGRIPQMLDVHGRRVTGGSFPAAIWAKFMQEVLKRTESTDFVAPEIAPAARTKTPRACLAGAGPGGRGCGQGQSAVDPPQLPAPVPPEYRSPQGDDIDPLPQADPVPPKQPPQAPAGGLLGLFE